MLVHIWNVLEIRDAVDKSVVSQEKGVRLVCLGDASLGKGFPQFRRKALNSSSNVKWKPATIEDADKAFLQTTLSFEASQLHPQNIGITSYTSVKTANLDC